MITQLDHRCGVEHAGLVEEELTVLERVNVTLDQEQVGAALDGQEALSRNINSMSVLEVLDSGTSSSLELNDSVTIIGGLGVDDDIKLHTLELHDALEG